VFISQVQFHFNGSDEADFDCPSDSETPFPTFSLGDNKEDRAPTNTFSSGSSSKDVGKRPRPNFRFDSRSISDIYTCI